ncbi:1-(5-phosphoribosyl)-5-[(5-phosphoribosylamino)methylideneamino] imidazole-4-carboxamide isomerase [Rhodobacteraceae bacterium D3-12]|nr:1-(5-phosphoribosyl)-5-[(5-phosphoribosylamino)methylideneamino] imidazole-4-carboxamide isomerase [Rhodobacteraceae bacterium D3-12]
MIIYPTLELQNGKCVTLRRGRFDEPSIFHVDPVETVQKWAAEGAHWVHVTDFDAIAGTGNNAGLIEEIIRVVPASVQLAGGFRSAEQVSGWIDKGAGRIVLGTLPARDPDTVKRLARDYPDQIVLALDIWQGQLMTDGWQAPAAIAPEAFLQSYAGDPLAGVLITDIDSDIEESDGTLGVITALAAQTRHPVIASGLVRGVDDIARLSHVPNIAGTLVGRALFAQDVDLVEALSIAQPSAERVAEFL